MCKGLSQSVPLASGLLVRITIASYSTNNVFNNFANLYTILKFCEHTLYNIEIFAPFLFRISAMLDKL